jgi:hypothetical protein
VTLDGLILGYGAASQAQVGQAAFILRDLLDPAGSLLPAPEPAILASPLPA